MNRTKFFSSLLVGAMFLASTSVFVSCKDYDDDIKNLQTQIDKNTSAISAIQTLIQNGKVLQSVESISGGIRITIDGTPYEIKNGTDGANGTVWTIGADGYWYKDGVATTYYALGTKGEKGEKGADGVNADGSSKYYVPNATTGTFWIYNDGDKQPYDSGISFIVEIPGQGATITAVRSNDTLTLFGVEGGEGALRAVAISLNGTLKGLVFKPEYYFDGIETIIYPWIESRIMKQPNTAIYQISRQRNSETEKKDITLLGIIPSVNDEIATTKIDWWGNFYLPTTAVDRQEFIPTVQKWIYGPAWAVNYHMNPANSLIEYADVKGWNVLNPEVINYHTRAAAATDFTSPEKTWGEKGQKQLFNTANGYVTVGLQIANPQDLNTHPTLDVFNDEGDQKNNNTVALQVNSEEGEITSDYALIYPQKAVVEGLAYKKFQNAYTIVGTNNVGVDDGNRTSFTSNYRGRVGGETSTARLGDLECEMGVSAFYQTVKCHVWDTPIGALTDPDGAALELYWNSDEGINLRDFLEIHLAEDQINRMNADYTYPQIRKELDCSNYEEEQWGLKLEFKLVNYEISGNVTRDSKFAEMKDSYNGQVIAWDSKETADTKGETIFKHNKNAIGREPLVQVLVKNVKGDVVLDGYILLHICAEAPEVKDNKEIDFPEHEMISFNLCDAADVLTTNWTEFNRFVLNEGLNQMTKEQFDEIYECVPTTGATINNVGGYTYYETDQFGLTWADLAKGPHNALTVWNGINGKIGNIYYYPNWEGTTNHVFQWVIPADELEALTHHMTEPLVIDRWVRFAVNYGSGAAALAPYPYVYIKLTTTLTRDGVSEVKFAKNDNYWFGLSGNPAGWDATIFDVREPRDNADIVSFTRNIRSTLLGNIEGFNPHKYYFAAIDKEVTDEYDGTVYVITANGGNQTNYNKLYCKYVNGSAEIHTFTTEEEMFKLMDKCAIDFGSNWTDTGLGTLTEVRSAYPTINTYIPKGMFDNTKLYAYIKSVPTSIQQIAEMNPLTGEIQLIKNQMAKDVLNAVGYAEDNANADVQLRTWAGIIGSNGCNVAIKVRDQETQRNSGQFLVSWERPVNLDVRGDAVVDAKTNANYLYLVDLLRLYDWRGLKYDVNHEIVDEDSRYDFNSTATNGHMWGNQQWFWAYYNIYEIDVDVTPSKVYTNMHNHATDVKDFEPLSSFTRQAILEAGSTTIPQFAGYVPVNLATSITGWPAAYDMASKNSDLLRIMGISPKDDNVKKNWGYIYYSNNGDNVTDFDLLIPVTVKYEWGEFTRMIKVHVGTTQGNGE